MTKNTQEETPRTEFRKAKESYLESEIKSQLHLGGCGIHKLLLAPMLYPLDQDSLNALQCH